MKKSDLGLITVAALLVCGTAYAAEAQQATPPKAEPVAATAAPASAVAAAQTTPSKQEPAASAEPKPVVKHAKSKKVAKTKRAQDLDLRHCLELTDNAAIAKCAGE